MKLVAWFVPLVACLVPLAGCSDRHAPPESQPADKRTPVAVTAPAPEPASAPAPAPTPALPVAMTPCTVKGVELIYLVDTASELLSFDPRKLPEDPFDVIGTLKCDTTSHPFAMSIDRDGIAWVLYYDGKLFRVSIADARCSPAGQPVGRDLPRLYAMSFVKDGAKSTSDTLYLVSRDQLGRLDVSTAPPRWSPVTALASPSPEAPDLATTDGKLFAFFSEPGPGFVQELDLATGALVGPRQSLGAAAGHDEAWAIAHYAGMFYVFTTIDAVPAVHSIRRKTGEYKLVRDHLPFEIVGAGVSTCAPELEKP